MHLLAATEWTDVLVEWGKAAGLAGGAVAAVISYLSHRKTKEINDAVNHRHKRRDENGEIPPKLFDAVMANATNTRHLQGHMLELRGDVNRMQGHLDAYTRRLDHHMEADSAAHVDLTARLDKINEALAEIPRNPWSIDAE